MRVRAPGLKFAGAGWSGVRETILLVIDDPLLVIDDPRSLVVPNRCSQCKRVSFCNKACLKRGWKQHKLACYPVTSPAQKADG